MRVVPVGIAHSQCSQSRFLNYTIGRCVLVADRLIRTIAPPITITNESARNHGSRHRKKLSGVLVAIDKEAATAIVLRKRPKVTVVTISLPLATNATTDPTNINAMKWYTGTLSRRPTLPALRHREPGRPRCRP